MLSVCLSVCQNNPISVWPTARTGGGSTLQHSIPVDSAMDRYANESVSTFIPPLHSPPLKNNLNSFFEMQAGYIVVSAGAVGYLQVWVVTNGGKRAA